MVRRATTDFGEGSRRDTGSDSCRIPSTTVEKADRNTGYGVPRPVLSVVGGGARRSKFTVGCGL